MRKRRKPSQKRTASSRRGRKKERVFTWKSVAGLGVLVFALAIGYLAQISAVSDKGHRIRVLENEVAELKEQRADMELQIARERSMRVVEDRVRELGMVPAQNVEYLTPTEPVVAKR